jgi:hypothetical protein
MGHPQRVFVLQPLISERTGMCGRLRPRYLF